MPPSGPDRQPRVVVLMSTFNGERYVGPQLESILAQLAPTGAVLVRDDGSSDGTVARVEALGDVRVVVHRGPNMGFAASFLTLLAQVGPDADLVMFADQDDVWLPGKIDRAWQHLAPFGDRAALYGSAQTLVDSDLRELGYGGMQPPVTASLSAALCENFITGCTAALNRPAVALLQRAGVPPDVHFHDWWAYLVVSAFGKVVYDAESRILYRQHAGNQIGRGAGWLHRQAMIIRFLIRHDWVGILLGQVAAFMRCYGEALPEPSRLLVDRHFRFDGERAGPTLRLLLGSQRWRSSWLWELAFRTLVLLHALRLWPLPGRRLRRRMGAWAWPPADSPLRATDRFAGRSDGAATPQGPSHQGRDDPFAGDGREHGSQRPE